MTDYKFVEKLGEGSFGEVWRVLDSRTGDELALKYLHIEHLSKDSLEHFKQEFQILSEIKHANLANVYDFGYSSEKKQYYFTSEYCQGKEFIEAARGKPVAYIEEMLVQILSALDYVHSQGIVHFDIKSENVLVSEEDGKPHIKILDFGVASKLKALPQGVTGTPSYMAPEIITEGAKVDHRADLYSVGMLLLRTLTGKLPFDAADTDEVLKWHLKGELPASIWNDTEIPAYLREVVEKLLEKNPVDRFSNARVILNFLNVSTGQKYSKIEQSLEGRIPREGPLVGRERTIEKLHQRLENLPSISVLGGVRGMGKTRIINEIRHAIELKEMPFFEVVCDWQIPAWPKLDKWLGITTGKFSDVSEEWQTRARVDAIVERTKKGPTCILIDEFHKADPATKNLIPALEEKLGRIRENGQSIPLFILIATEDKPSGAIQLERLTASGIAKYIELVLGEVKDAGKLSKLLYQYSGGLPLLMVEGLRFLAPHLYRNERLGDLLPPPQIGLLYKEKIESLDPNEKDFLSTLALLFRPATERELSSILSIEAESVYRLASNCIKQELVTYTPAAEDRKATYQISSQALSLDLIQSAEPEQSKMLHLRIATGLARISEEPLNEIAYHIAKGGDVDTAVGYYRKAAALFKSKHEISTATGCLVKAIGFCKHGTTIWKELLQEASQLLIFSGMYHEAEEYLRMLGDYSTSSSEELKGLLAMKQRKFAEARRSYEKAIKLLPGDAKRQRILIKNSIANLDLQEGNLKECIRIFRKALDEERELPIEEQRKISNNSLGLVLAMQGDFDDALQFYEEQKKNLEPGNTNDEISTENGMGYVLFLASRYDEAIPHLKKAMELSEQSGAMHSLFSSMGNLIIALLKEARYSDSLPLLTKMRDYQEKFGTARDIAYNLLREGNVYLTMGMEEVALECFRRGRRLSKKIDEKGLAAWFLVMEGYREREYGDLEKALELLLLAEKEAEELGDGELISCVHYSIADMYSNQGNSEKCSLQLNLITDPPKDNEFRIRVDLLKAQLKAGTVDGSVDSLFTPLEAQCIDHKLKELLWEVYHGWAKAKIARGERAEAIPLLSKGVNIIETISKDLPEEYRDRYLRQRSRKHLLDDYKSITSPTRVKKRKTAEIHADEGQTEGTIVESAPKKKGDN